jgi:hypothetical protein
MLQFFVQGIEDTHVPLDDLSDILASYPIPRVHYCRATQRNLDLTESHALSHHESSRGTNCVRSRPPPSILDVG